MQLTKVLTTLVLPLTVLGASLPLRIIQYNIRYDTSSLETNEKPWWSLLCTFDSSKCRYTHTVAHIVEQATETDTAIVNLQEALNNQLGDVMDGLGSSWSYIGVGRDDGKESGEYSPIIYRNDVLKVVFSETKWLSPTPDVVSYGWGAGSRRIVTLAVFEHIATGKRFMHANTHLDNVASEARVEGIKVVMARITAAQATYGPIAVSLTGDFNSAPNGDAYNELKSLNYMEDSWDVSTHVGSNQLTYTGFTQTGISRIDFIWFGPTNVDVGKYITPGSVEILGNYVDDMYLSDHRMVVGDLTLV